MRSLPADLLFQSFLYVAGGINHFWHKQFYLRMMPDHYSHTDFLVKLSGAVEIAGGFGLLIPATRRKAALGICALLVVFLDVHQFMLLHSERYPQIPRWLLWTRLPLQGALIWWAARYTKDLGVRA